MSERLSIRDLAKIAGVSRATVSLALRGSHEISKETRERIKALAIEHDYRSHPAINRLMTQVRSGKKVQDEETIAYIHSGRDAEERSLHVQEIITAAREEGHRLGYKLEFFWAGDMGVNSMKLAKILYHRGIRGVLWGPIRHPHPPVRFPWHKFIAVACTTALDVPNVPIVGIHHTKGMALLLENLYRLGARRMGLFLRSMDETRLDYGWGTGVDLYHYRGGKGIVVRKVIKQTFLEKDILSWVKQHRLDVLLVTSNLYQEIHFLEGKIARAVIDVPKAGFGVMGGLHQGMSRVGIEAVRQLSLRLVNDALGLPENPYFYLMQGSFVDGDSLSLLKKKALQSKRK